MVELLQEAVVGLEQRFGPGPTVQQPADPNPRQQSEAELDAASPVDAGQERVGRPPGPELGGNGPGVPLVAVKMVRSRQDRQVLVPRRLPHLLDVTDCGRAAVVDVEAVGAVGGPPAGGRVQEPVGRRGHVGAQLAEYRPVAAEQPLGGLLEPHTSLLRDVVAVWGQSSGEGSAVDRRAGTVGVGITNLPPTPGAPSQLVASPARHLRWRHAGQPSRIPYEVHVIATPSSARPEVASADAASATASRRRLARLRRTAKVAKVVAISDSNGIGIAPASATARTKASNSCFWPLLMPVRDRRTWRRPPRHSSVHWKLCSRASCRSPVTCNNSFGARESPRVW